MPQQKTFWIYAFLVVYSLAPVLSLLVSLGVAQLQGCTLSVNEQSVCKVFGQDVSSLLLIGALLSTYAVFTVPTGLFAMLGVKIYTMIKMKSKPAV